MASLAWLALLSSAAALELSPRLRLPSRRAAVSILVSLPTAAAALPSFDKGDLGLKERPPPPKCRPDGFGGKICTDAEDANASRTAPVISRLGRSERSEVPAAKAPAAPAAAPPTTKSSSTPALSVDQMVQNSINQKADLLGRDLTPAEIEDITAKVKKFAASR